MESGGQADGRARRALGLGLLTLGLVGVFLAGCRRPGDSFVSGVYVQDVFTTGAVVAIATRKDEAIRVFWGDALTDDRLPNEIVEDGARRLHAVHISNLVPDTLYRYRVEDGTGGVLGESTFQTAPLRGGRAVTFAAVGDTGQVDETEGTFEGEIEDLVGSGSSKGRQNLVVNAILRASPPPELLIHSGDVLQGSGERRFYHDAFFKPFGPLIDHIPIFPAMGNHDAGERSGAPWLDAFTTPANNVEKNERYYSFDWGDVHFVALDVHTSSFGPGSAQRDFLEADLAGTTAVWRIVYFHRPPFSDGKSGDSEIIKAELVPVFETHAVDLVICGNEHAYQRFAPVGGVTYIVLGSGGASLRGFHQTSRLEAGARGYQFLRGTADANHLEIEAVEHTDEILDSFTLTH